MAALVGGGGPRPPGGMMVTELNPPWLDTAAYIDFLNGGFPGQWDAASFDFYVGRSFLGRATDIGVISDGGRLLAGVSYCHRQIRSGVDSPIDVCVMSAGTTLRSERGRGHYRQLLQTGLDLCRERSYAAILGFVTRDNASARGLQRLGAYSIPSFYIVSGGRKPLHRSELRALHRLPLAGEVSRREAEMAAADQVTFCYPQYSDWLQQFAYRANRVRVVRLAHDSVALLEAVGDTDRLQWLGCPPHRVTACMRMLAGASRAGNRKFFMYTLDPSLARTATRLGLSIRAGLLMLLPVDGARADWQRIAGARWNLQSGDRM